MKNYAGRKDAKQLDDDLAAELTAAGINVERLPEGFRENSSVEVKSIVVGTLFGWTFHRAWYYWIAKGPGLPLEDAMHLHETHGKEVRIDGHCGCPSPVEWFKGLGSGHYHVDSQEGLKALADTIRAVVERALAKYPAPFTSWVKEDGVEVKCSCGEEIEGEGEPIAAFKAAHKHHTNGQIQESHWEGGKPYRGEIITTTTPV